MDLHRPRRQYHHYILLYIAIRKYRDLQIYLDDGKTCAKHSTYQKKTLDRICLQHLLQALMRVHVGNNQELSETKTKETSSESGSNKNCSSSCLIRVSHVLTCFCLNIMLLCQRPGKTSKGENTARRNLAKLGWVAWGRETWRKRSEQRSTKNLIFLVVSTWESSPNKG